MQVRRNSVFVMMIKAHPSGWAFFTRANFIRKVPCMIISLLKKMYLIWCAFVVFLKEERAATAIEYALIAAGIALAIVAVVFTLGDSVLGLFQSVETELETSL